MAVAIVLALLSTLGSGSSALFVRLATQRLAVPVAAFFAVVTAALIAITSVFIFNFGDIWQLAPIAFAWFALLASVHHLLARMLNFTAISMIGASRAAPIVSTSPIFSAALAISLLGERPNALVYIGTFMVVGGMVLVVTGGLQAAGARPEVRSNNLGYLFAIGGSMAYGAMDVIVKHITSEFAPPLVTATFSILIGTLLLAVISHRSVVSSLVPSQRGHVGHAMMAGVCGGLAILFYYSALSRAPVTVVSPVAAAYPLVTLVVVHVFLRRLESISPPLAIGTLITVAGIIMVIL